MFVSSKQGVKLNQRWHITGFPCPWKAEVIKLLLPTLSELGPQNLSQPSTLGIHIPLAGVDISGRSPKLELDLHSPLALN